MRKALRVLGALLALLAAAATSEVRAEEEEEWSYEIVPFLWAAGLDGRQGVAGVTADINESFSDLLEFVDVGGAMRFSARRPPVGWFGEASYVQLENNVGTALGPVRTKLGQTLAEFGVSYQVSAPLAAYIAARFQQLDAVIATQNLRRDGDKSWVDGVVGLRWTPLVSSTNWLAWVRADAGAGGSDLVWLAEAGGGYRWGTRWGVYLAYRILDTDYRQGGFIYDMQQSGLMFGFGVRF